jgi:Ca2+-transporting ATPase
MAVHADPSGRPALAGQRWSPCSPDAVAAALEVAPGTGLSSQRAAELPRANGPNALPEEKPKPGWRRFLDQYRSYLQLILVAAAVVSLVIKEWSTGVLLLVLTLPGQIRPGHPP